MNHFARKMQCMMKGKCRKGHVPEDASMKDQSASRECRVPVSRTVPETGAGKASAEPDLVASIESLGGMGSIIGIDPGAKRIGVAISDPARRVATPVGVVHRKRFADDAAEIRRLTQGRAADAIVVGLPLNMSGSEGPRAQSARALARNLSRELGLPAALWDERLSTAAVEKQMLAGDLPRARRSRLKDGAAAAYILQGALDRLSSKHASGTNVDSPAPVWNRDEPDSPCLSICVQHPGAGICVGCHRSPEEVLHWALYSHAERMRIRRELPSRAPRLVAAGGRPSRRRRRQQGARDSK